MSDVRPPIGPALALFGVAATVTLPGEEPVPTTAIWLSPITVDTAGVLVPTNRPQGVLALPRADVPSVPRGTRIVAPEMEGGPILDWAVEAILGMTADEIRVIVIPSEAP